MYSSGSPHTQQKGEEKGGSLIRKTGFKNHQKEQKSSEKDYIHTKTTFLDKERCQRKQMTCQNPFKREKDTEEKRKPLRIHFRHFKNGPLIFLPHLKITQSTHKQV